jgi:hypothetical protein
MADIPETTNTSAQYSDNLPEGFANFSIRKLSDYYHIGKDTLAKWKKDGINIHDPVAVGNMCQLSNSAHLNPAATIVEQISDYGDDGDDVVLLKVRFVDMGDTFTQLFRT